MSIPLKANYKISRLGIYEASSLICGLTGQREEEVLNALDEHYCTVQNSNSTSAADSQYVYVVTNRLMPKEEAEALQKIKKNHRFWTTYDLFYHSKENYLEKHFAILRLVKPGNVCIPFRYYYTGEQPLSGEHKLQYSERMRSVENEESVFDAGDLNRVERLESKSSRLFRDEPFILALDALEASYGTFYVPRLAFITLMSGLEALLNDKAIEITETIARSVGVLLSANDIEGEQLYKDIKKLYGLRSDIIHGKKSVIVSEKDIKRLREVVRLVILKMIAINKDKKDIVPLIRSKGYGKLHFKRF